jgi:hypothetical protein
MIAESIPQLGRPFTENYRKLFSLPKKFSGAITYLPNNYCCIDVPKIPDLAQKYE